MKQIIFLLIGGLGFGSCNQGSTNGTTIEAAVDTLNVVSTEEEQLDELVKDIPLHDQSFIDGLSEYSGPIALIDNYILVDRDTVYFPEDIPLRTKTTFSATEGEKVFLLHVTRPNLTRLHYDFQILDGDSEETYRQSGDAILGSLFFFGAETDVDDITGVAYLSVEYWDHSSETSFSIRVGEKDDDDQLRAKIKLYCKSDTSKSIDLADHPTLRTE